MREEERELSFRVYLTDAAKLICENAARIGGGQTLRRRWIEGIPAVRRGKSSGGAGTGNGPDSTVADTLARLRDSAGIRIVGAEEEGDG